MDLVLGLSVTSTAVRWVLVEGTTGEGAPVDRGALDITDDAPFDADGLLSVLLDANESVVESGVHAVGVTWTTDADAAAGALSWRRWTARGLENVVSVSEIEAAEALAGGIADIAGYDDVAVCIFEPDATLVAMVNADGVTVDRQDRPADGDDDVELTGSVIALDLNDRQLDAIFVVGSADLDPVVSSMDTVAAAPVISSAEADMAMARGRRWPSALAVNTLDDAAAPLLKLRGMSKTAVLTSVVAAAAVTLVVSLSVALGLQATPDSHSEPDPERQRRPASRFGKAVPSAAKAAQAAPKLARGLLRRSPLLPHPRRPAAGRADDAVAAPPAPAAPAPVYDPPRLLRPRLRMFRPHRCTCRPRPPMCHRHPRTSRLPRRRRMFRRATASPCGAAGTASARQDHRAHSDHQSVPRAAVSVPEALAAPLLRERAATAKNCRKIRSHARWAIPPAPESM